MHHPLGFIRAIRFIRVIRGKVLLVAALPRWAAIHHFLCTLRKFSAVYPVLKICAICESVDGRWLSSNLLFSSWSFVDS